MGTPENQNKKDGGYEGIKEFEEPETPQNQTPDDSPDQISNASNQTDTTTSTKPKIDPRLLIGGAILLVGMVILGALTGPIMDPKN